MLWDGDIKCVENLLKPAEKIIKKGMAINREALEKRIQIWNEIKENQEKYEDGECGKFLEDLDMHFRALFDIASLIIERSFIINNDDFSPQKYSKEEINAYNQIEKYNVFEIMTKNDIKKRVITKDKDVLNLFRDYYVYMDDWIDEMIENAEIRITIKYYIKKKWEEYKEKLNEAINELISELNWFRKLINEWQKETKEEVEKVSMEMKKRVEEKEEELKKQIEEIKAMKEKIDKESRFVDIGEAKFYENNFIGRMKNKLKPEIIVSGKKFIVEDVREYKEEDVSKYVDQLERKEINNLPENRYIEAILREKKLLGKKQEIIFKGIFLSRVEKYAEYGFDTDPLEITDINPYLSDAMDTIMLKKKEKMLLCIASPTGFSLQVREHMEGEDFHKNFLSTVSVCLIDMETGKLIINPHDEIAQDFKEIFMLEIDKEKMAKIKRCIEEKLIEKDYICLKDAIKLCGDKKLVKKVFYDFEDEKGYKVKYIRNVGLVLVRG